MKHRQRADEQDEIYDQREICDETGNFVVDSHTDERDGESNQAGENARANGIQPESGRDAALFLDAHGCLQRVLKHAGEPASLVFREFAGDDGVTAIDGIADNWRRLN